MQLIEAQNATFAAVSLYFRQAPSLATLAGPWRETAPNPALAPYPYAVVSFDPDGRVETTSEGVIFDINFRLKAFDRDLNLVDAHRALMATVFHDDLELPLAVGRQLMFRVQNGSSMEEEPRICQGWIECRLSGWVPR